MVCRWRYGGALMAEDIPSGGPDPKRLQTHQEETKLSMQWFAGEDITEGVAPCLGAI